MKLALIAYGTRSRENSLKRIAVLLSGLAIGTLAACSGEKAAPVVNVTPTVLPTAPATFVLSAPTAAPALSPVQFVWSITGEPNRLDTPADLATDTQGNLYVVDAGNNRIQIFDPDGQFVTMWGKAGKGQGEFNFARANGDKIGAVTLDTQGNVYVADNANQRIQKFDHNGTFLLQWGGNGTNDGQFTSPIGIAVDQQGAVYVIDDSRDDVQKFDNQGRFLLKWGSHGTDDGQFNYTGKLTIDGEDNLYVADFANHRVQKFDSQGAFLMKWGTRGKNPGQFNDPAGIAVDHQGNVYVVEYAAHLPATYRVQKFDSRGNLLASWGRPGMKDGEFVHPLAVTVDSQGAIYVSDETNRIQKFKPR
jgi:DNA-binding beta-propeller fold protein YncE